MTSKDVKNQIDELWTEFWTGGIANPLTIIEQISFLIFSRLLDTMEIRNENREKRTGKAVKKIFGKKDQDIRWSHLKNDSGPEMLAKMRDRVFPHFQNISMSGSQFKEFMKDAQLMIAKPNLLVAAVSMVDRLPLKESDTKGDLYEYLLR